MDRIEAVQLMEKYVTNTNLRKHCLAAEFVMRRLARHFGEDKKIWGLAGLLHDIDYDQTKDDPARHSQVGADLLAELGLPEEVVYAVRVHNEYHGLPRLSRLDKALYSVDPTTGLIVAGALIRPEKKLAAVDVPFLVNRFHEKSFARGANREQIQACTELGLSLEEFLGLALEAMQEHSEELGL
ncbi:HDIG domain-containing protein [Carboxydocella sporoproducens DSM 16521]|uniref:HDIG domain-containing protein n=2 Tax=Carboxydocella TaxID=178898 RepID=A0A1T4SE68_9FIRM|nr:MULTISPECIES: HDIG domain-containing metalloprotein [Carboxydocella]AVX19753.1 HDIG domain-containing protein [Carboxydocella thermautotrophica]SKA26499.1 HDIG domain-containing protein [Carboxydocella sporoproducens DSM 16521]